MMPVLCFDMEGVFTPEMWINVAEKTGIEKLKLTTRDISDYDVLMAGRLKLLRQHNISLTDIQAVIAGMKPLDGAAEFLDWARLQAPVILVSDTFREFAAPLIAQLGQPTLFCNWLEVDENQMIVSYHLRQPDGKRKVALALNSINAKVVGIGDSYNDITMLTTAHKGILFRPPENVKAEYPNFPVATTYAQLKPLITDALTS